MAITILQVIDTILDAVPGAQREETVDIIKAGDASQPVKGIVTTFMASYAVIRKAVSLGANLIITHEPTFYNHLDQVGWLESDPVYQQKRKLIDDNGLVIWRFHDNWHIHQPDGLLTGLVKQLGWEGFADPQEPGVFHLPPISLADLAASFKSKLNIHTLRMVGKPEMICRKVGILVGAWGGTNQILFYGKNNPDVLVCGEIAEWETSEYVRDAVAQGKQKALLVLGHANSEEPGMSYLVEWLQPRFPGIAIHHVPIGDAFLYR